jgi:hypothetical protein
MSCLVTVGANTMTVRQVGGGARNINDGLQLPDHVQDLLLQYI